MPPLLTPPPQKKSLKSYMYLIRHLRENFGGGGNGSGEKYWIPDINPELLLV